MSGMLLPKLIRNYALTIWLFTAWILYLFVLLQFDLWHWIGVPHIEPLFADLHAVLSAAECHRQGVDVFVSNPCDAMGRVHVYGSLWLNLSHLNLTLADLWFAGVSLTLVFIFLVVCLLKPISHFELLSSALVLFSPAVTLGIERGNNDLIIFILLVASAVLIARQRILASIASILTTYLATVLKLYPSVSFGVIILIARRNLKELIFVTSLVLVLVTFWIATDLNEILTLRNSVPRPLDHYVTGANAMYVYLSRSFPALLVISSQQFILLLAAGMALSTVLLTRKLNATDFTRISVDFTYVIFVFGLSILCFTYLINTNYDYRWIFFILMMPLLFKIRRSASVSTQTKSLLKLIFTCALIIVWTEELRATPIWTESMRASRIFGFYNYSLYNYFISPYISLPALQQCAREISAWILFCTSFSFATKIFLSRRSQ